VCRQGSFDQPGAEGGRFQRQDVPRAGVDLDRHRGRQMLRAAGV
jgi:hypothetical protein